MKTKISSTQTPKLWESETTYHWGPPYFKDLLQALRTAKKSIEFETFIFAEDDLGHQILDALGQAAHRGVRVRLLIDGAGSPYFTSWRIRELKKQGINTHIFRPLPWQVSKLRWPRFLMVSRIWKYWTGLNHRNHRKSCIIDGEQAFVGGMNVTSEYLETVQDQLRMRDTSIQICGPSVATLQAAFDSAWTGRIGRSKRVRFSHTPAIRLNVTRRLRLKNYRNLLERLIRSKQVIWITTPYFVPDFRLLRVLRFAAWYGVDVRILLPGENDVFFMTYANRIFARVLSQSGVKIHEYLPAILHAKVWIIDDWGTVGSSNLNSRSLIHDLEVDIEVEQQIQELKDQFLRDWKQSRPIPSRKLHGLSRVLQWFIEKVLLSFRYWL